MNYLKMNGLKHGYLYKIHARNACFGIWDASKRGFVISRHKFGGNFTFMEFHWDCESFATVRPHKELVESPFDPSDYNEAKILKYLNDVTERCNQYEPETDICNNGLKLECYYNLCIKKTTLRCPSCGRYNEIDAELPRNCIFCGVPSVIMGG